MEGTRCGRHEAHRDAHRPARCDRQLSHARRERSGVARDRADHERQGSPIAEPQLELARGSREARAEIEPVHRRDATGQAHSVAIGGAARDVRAVSENDVETSVRGPARELLRRDLEHPFRRGGPPNAARGARSPQPSEEAPLDFHRGGLRGCAEVALDGEVEFPAADHAAGQRQGMTRLRFAPEEIHLGDQVDRRPLDDETRRVGDVQPHRHRDAGPLGVVALDHHRGRVVSAGKALGIEAHRDIERSSRRNPAPGGICGEPRNVARAPDHGVVEDER